MKQIKQMKDVNTEQDTEFEYEHISFKINYNYKKFFERAFGVEVLTAYTEGGNTVGKVLDLGCVDILLFLRSGRILQMSNSEWGSLEIVK